MKKKTKLQASSEADEVKPRQHGPQKEKTQITVRVDRDLMNEAYAQMKEDNTRITDIVERGIYLALRERNHQMPVFAKQVRFMVANATKEQQVLLRGLLIAMAEPLLDWTALEAKVAAEKRVLPEVKVEGQKRAQAVYVSHHGSARSPEVEKLYEMVRWFLETRNKVVHANACLEVYSRYGKSAEEMAELAAL